MIVTTSGGAHVCSAAEQRKDGVYLLNEDGSIKLIITKPSDIKDVQGGEIAVVEEMPPTDKQRITELEEALTAIEEGIASV